MKVQLVNELAIPPTRPEYGDCGYDLVSPIDVPLLDGGQIKIPLGFYLQIPYTWCGIIKDRRSMAAKGIHVLGDVIYPSYRGEIIVILKNLSTIPYYIERGNKIAQLVIVKYFYPEVKLVTRLNKSKRGGQGFGSTGK